MFATFRGVSFEWPNGDIQFENIDLALNQKKYGLVGANGIGKSTLARLLAGQYAASSGKVQVEGQVYFFEQSAEAGSQSVFDYLSEGDWISALGHRLIEGISKDAPCFQLSGGQWIKVRLARAAFLEPDFLILDEPSNNLDAEGREVLREFVRAFAGGVLLISHDRDLLDEVDEIIELTSNGISHYGGPWSFYEEMRSKERARLALNLEKSKQEVGSAHQSRAKKVQAQEKRMRQGKATAHKKGLPKIVLGAMKRKAEKTLNQIDQSTAEAAAQAASRAWEAYREIKADPIMYTKLSEVAINPKQLLAGSTDLQFTYEASDQPVFSKPLNFYWRGPVRVALQGANGSGKSTLIRLLARNQLPGKILGKLNLGMAFVQVLDQDYRSLLPDLNLIENIRSTYQAQESEIRGELAKFLFQGDKIFQKASSLSGGEKLRLSLAMALMGDRPPEFLILDEPTNNLDIENVEFLEQLLNQYKGALLVTSHDQEFLNKIGLNEELRL